MYRFVSTAALLLSACSPPTCPTAAEWQGRPDAAAFLLETCAAGAPQPLREWLAEEAAVRDRTIPAELVDTWGRVCPAAPAAEVSESAASLRRIASDCGLPAGFSDGEELVQVTGNPVLALVTRAWLLEAGVDAAGAEAAALALRGALPYAGAVLELPTVPGPRSAHVAHVVLGHDGVRGVAPGPQPLGGGAGGWSVPAWAGLAPEKGQSVVIAADARASAQDLIRLAASVSPQGTFRLAGITDRGVGGIDLGLDSEGSVATISVTPWGTQVAGLPPVEGCSGPMTVCPEAAHALGGVLASLPADQPITLAVSAPLTVADLVRAALAVPADRGVVRLSLSDSPCVPSLGGMLCVPGSPTPLGAADQADNPPHVTQLSTFYLDIEDTPAEAYQTCVSAGFCPAGWANPSWEAANRYCTWSGKRLPTEWEWEKAALFGVVGTTSHWTRTWKEGATCGAACEGPDPLGPCGGSEPCGSSAVRVRRGGVDVPVARRSGVSPGSRSPTGIRCALSGAISQDPPAFVGRGTDVRSPVLTRAAPPRPLPTLAAPEPPTAAELAIVAHLAVDSIEDKPVCGEEKIKEWNFPRGGGGRSDLDCRDPISYVETNEKRLDTFTDTIRDLGGAYAGVGADQNYDLIAQAHSRWAFLFDYEPNVVRLHKVLRALILGADSPETFVAAFLPASTSASMDRIAETWGDDPQMATYQRLYLGYQARLHAIYTRALTPRAEDPRFGWLAHAEQYTYIRTLYQQGRIVALPGDMLAKSTMREVGRATRELGVPMRIFYTSNAPTSWGGGITSDWRANVDALPFDDASVVLVTWNRGSFGGTDYWHYNAQRALTYQKRLSHPGYLYMWQLAWDRIPGLDPNLTLTNLSAAGE